MAFTLSSASLADRIADALIFCNEDFERSSSTSASGPSQFYPAQTASSSSSSTSAFSSNTQNRGTAGSSTMSATSGNMAHFDSRSDFANALQGDDRASVSGSLEEPLVVDRLIAFKEWLSAERLLKQFLHSNGKGGTAHVVLNICPRAFKVCAYPFAVRVV